MSLPAGQRRTLDQIEHALQGSEPHLASKFAIFTRLTSPDGPARTERIQAPRFRARLRSGFRFGAGGLRAAALIPIAIGLLITGIVLGGTAHGSGGCLRGWRAMPARGSAGCGLGTQPARSVRPAPARAPSQSTQPTGTANPATEPGHA